jgi:hypothetical protein
MTPNPRLHNQIHLLMLSSRANFFDRKIIKLVCKPYELPEIKIKIVGEKC